MTWTCEMKEKKKRKEKKPHNIAQRSYRRRLEYINCKTLPKSTCCSARAFIQPLISVQDLAQGQFLSSEKLV